MEGDPSLVIYGRAAPVYRTHGWVGVLPLPAGAKAHPPTGYTGAAGVDPTEAQIEAWRREQPAGNVALRLPEGVIGIDIDAYGDKHGDASVLALEAELGLLPATWRSTSRSGRSGIYLYRVPIGRYQDQPAPSIEIIQHHHRYVVVMPSVHPEGRAYVWIDDQGAEQRRPPRIDELAWLPEPWLEQLRPHEHTDTATPPRHHQVDDWSAAVTRAFSKALMDMPSGRHDAAMHASLALVRLWSLEHPGAAEALDALGVRFRAAIADRASPAQADKEWSDLVNGARKITDETPPIAPKWEPWPSGADPRDVDEWLAHANADPTVPAFGGLVDWPSFWQREHADEDWLCEPVLARGRAHALYAPAKAGKSLLALEIAAAIATGRPVLGQASGPARVVGYVDFEMTETDLYERLSDLGYGPDTDLTKLHYYLLPDLPALDTPRGGALLVAEMVRVGAELAVVDTVARSISGEEDRSDTIIALARCTFSPLKRAGITTLRVDHAGKSLERGQRGTSAKNDDVDVVWRLTIVDDGVTLAATHRRLAWVPEMVTIKREESPLRHRISGAAAWPKGTQETADKLDALGAPRDISTRAAQALVGGARAVVVAACKYRREWPPTGQNHPQNHPLGQSQNHLSEPLQPMPSEQGEPLTEPLRTTGTGKSEPPPGSNKEPGGSEPGRIGLDRWQTEEF